MAKSVYNDPLAQTFQVATPGGVFATSVDLFFLSKDANIPVTVQIREVFNGYPTPKIVPFSEVTLEPQYVNVVDLELEDPDPTVGTRFTFPAPVYLQDGVEYALTVVANSTDYRLWVAVLGEDEYGTGIRITKNAYTGVLFASQNATTWLPDMNMDLKFTINRAIFDLGASGRLVLKNEAPEVSYLTRNPVRTRNGNNLVEITQRNHGFFKPQNGISSYVVLSGFGAATSYNGVLGAVFNGEHEIVSCSQDSYVIDISAAAAYLNPPTGTGITGGEGLTATRQLVFNTLSANIDALRFPGTSASLSYKATEGLSLADDSSTPYVKDDTWRTIINNKNVYRSKPAVVAQPENFVGNSLEVKVDFESATTNLTPVIDLQRASITTVENRIDKPGGSSWTDVVQTSVSPNNGDGAIFDISVSGSTYVVDAIVNGGATYSVSDQITISGSDLGGSSPTNDLVLNVVSVSGGVITAVSVVSGLSVSTTSKNLVTNYISEYSAKGGSALSKYVTKLVRLNNVSTTLKCYIDVNRPSGSNVELYYRIGENVDSLEEQDWELATSTLPIPFTDNTYRFNEVEYDIEPGIDFNVFQVKIVFLSSNSSNVPVVRALRAIALA